MMPESYIWVAKACAVAQRVPDPNRLYDAGQSRLLILGSLFLLFLCGVDSRLNCEMASPLMLDAILIKVDAVHLMIRNSGAENAQIESHGYS
jgi:hypothetical protein